MAAPREVPRPDPEASRSARQAERRRRLAAIEAMPEAQGKTMPVKFGLALRFDLPLTQVRRLLREAPATDKLDAIFEWLDAIQAKPNLRLVR